MPTASLNPKVDAYLKSAPAYAQPILSHMRGLVHKGCPAVEESIKWSRPFFSYQGEIICNMAAFKEHCSFGFWGKEIVAVLREAKMQTVDGSNSLGCISSLKDLPSDKQMVGWIRQAAAYVDSGEHTSPIAARKKVAKPAKKDVPVPAELSAALEKNDKAASVFAAFSPSCKYEYVEWITEAKRPETRDKRIAAAVEWIAEGKQRHWKYQNC